MKKIIAIIGFVAIIILGTYLYFTTENTPNNQKDYQSEYENIPEYLTYSNPELGLSFSYRAGDRGYVVNEIKPSAAQSDHIRSIVVMRNEDAKNPPPVGGEGAPTITISVYENPQKQQATVWANANAQYSNINLKTSGISEKVVAGANAIQYSADGLYVSNNFVVAHGEKIYVISGAYLDTDSDLHRDFEPLVESIGFID